MLPETALGAWRVGEGFPPKQFCTIEYWGDPGIRPLQRQKDAVMVPNPRASSRGGSAPRDSSGSLASGEKISPRIVSVRSNAGETLGSRPLQRQEDAVMVPNPRAIARGGSAPREGLGAWRVGKIFPPKQFLYDRILRRPPVVDRYSAKKMP